MSARYSYRGSVCVFSLLLKYLNQVLKNLTLEPTDKLSVLKFDKFIYFKTINSEQGETSPYSSNLDNAIIIMSTVWPFAYAQGVQSSLTLGQNIIIGKLKKLLIA